MAWGAFEDPQERKAAAEAAEKMEQQRAREDKRTEELAAAIVTGFAAVADAILVAAGLGTHERDAFFANMTLASPHEPQDISTAPDYGDCSCDEAAREYCPQHADDGTTPAFVGGILTADDEVDDLIEPNQP